MIDLRGHSLIFKKSNAWTNPSNMILAYAFLALSIQYDFDSTMFVTIDRQKIWKQVPFWIEHTDGSLARVTPPLYYLPFHLSANGRFIGITDPDPLSVEMVYTPIDYLGKKMNFYITKPGKGKDALTKTFKISIKHTIKMEGQYKTFNHSLEILDDDIVIDYT